MTRRATLRASDADRERVAARLRQATDEGRLLFDEFEERLGAALAARTYGELDAVLSDLPAPSVVVNRREPRQTRPRPFVLVVLLLVFLAAVSSMAGGHTHADHGWASGGAPLFWFVLIAVGWRIFFHRRHRSG